ncbi:MAG: nucleotide exchange factor GrpE, partial [Ignavibacteriae bacterium]|nr:nucleotide exchange factor GrpE [Ignavibacteriota bacterium]
MIDFKRRKDDVPANTIIEEVEPGYMLNDKVLHHAKVIVSAAPEPRADSESVEKNKDVEET